jgi:hypothetical protein
MLNFIKFAVKSAVKNIIANEARKSLVLTAKIGAAMKVAAQILDVAGDIHINSVMTTTEMLLVGEEIDHRLAAAAEKALEIVGKAQFLSQFFQEEVRPMMQQSEQDTREILAAGSEFRAAHVAYFNEGSLKMFSMIPQMIEEVENLRRQRIIDLGVDAVLNKPENRIVDATEAGRVVAAVESRLRAAGFTVHTTPKD